MHPMLNIAVRAARSAGNIIARNFEKHDAIDVHMKGSNDFVTNIDKDAEKVIIDTILKAYPDHSIIGEESGVITGKDTEFQWIIDPLDGTTNFVRGIPHFCVSIALKYQGKLDQAVVYDPMRGELFTASRGKGAQLNEYRLRVKGAKDLNGIMVGTGLPFKNKHQGEDFFKMVQSLYSTVSDVRCSGSAALDLCYVAAGRLDGYLELGLKPWDTAAGLLMLKEAGGMATDFVGGMNYDASGNLIAGNPKVVQSLVKAIRPNLTEAMSK